MTETLPEHRRIAALIPCYDSSGDTTRIITVDGRSNTSKLRIRTIVKRLALSQCTDLSALRKQASTATQRAIMAPLPLAPGLVLCPVKVRQPRVAGDTSTGYVNYYAVTDVSKNSIRPYQSTIRLAGGATVPVLWSMATVNKHLSSARLALIQTPHYSNQLHEESGPYVHDVAPLVQKFVEIICDIVALKQKPH